MNISVAMATFNGEKYLQEQLNSILIQLELGDEIVISDDQSTDNTIKIIQEFMLMDSRINFFLGPGQGFVKNFENALLLCKNEIIFLCDQDDIWLAHKRSTVLAQFKRCEKTKLVRHRFKYLRGNTIEQCQYKGRNGLLINLLYSSYSGCSMAFRRDFIMKYVPFPKKLMAHDQWIGLCAERENSAFFIDDILIYHRIHTSNKTKKVNIFGKINFRIKMIKTYIGYFC